MTSRAIRWLLLALVATACGEAAPTATPEGTPWPVEGFPPLPEVMEGVPEARIELGRLLFYDPILSVDRETSCSTCHSERWGLSDALRRSVGHGAGRRAGPGRNGPNTLRRNSSTLYNLAFRETLTLDRRATTLEEQARIPLFAVDEMDVDPETMIAELSSIPEYRERFAAAFPDDPAISIDHVTAALAAYQRTFLSVGASYDKHVEGRPRALSEEMAEGMFRFAEMGCHDCHVPPLFESEIFANRSVPAVPGVVDHGLEETTGDPGDRGKFRTVTLRNAVLTEPYFHNGSVVALDDAVRHELAQGDQPFTEEDVRLITVFIAKALRDERHNALRPVSVPSGLPLSIDDPGSR